MDYNNICFGCFAEKGSQNHCQSCGYVPDNSKEAALYIKPGTIFAGKYLVGKILGQGGFGITYLGWDINLEIRIAIKEFFPQGLVSRVPGESTVLSYSGSVKEQFSFGVESFLREAKTLARFENHPNIVTVRDFFRENNTAYLVMSYVEGVTLEQYLRTKSGRISFINCLEIIMPILDALKEVHKAGIMHRDISPDNIFIDHGRRVILIDFGAARQEMREKSKSLSVILKAGYAPEEQYRSRGKQGPWTDIYAVAATMYRALTGQPPLEAIDRLAEDELITPTQLGIEIEFALETALLKAMAVKAEERYQTVDDFQAALVVSPVTGQLREGYAGVRQIEASDPSKVIIGGDELDQGQKMKLSPEAEVVKELEHKQITAQQQADRHSEKEAHFTISSKSVKTVFLAVVCGLLLFGGIKLFSSGIDPTNLADLDADYYIDYKNGTVLIGDLPIGSWVVDPGWEWEFRTGNNYSGSGAVKPVTWIVVAKDHYSGLEPHVTLLSQELIAKHAFDNSTNRSSSSGSNHWGESGTANATCGLRPWMNSSGIHENGGFYQAFSENFKGVLLAKTLPNKDWKNGNSYSTQDYVFILSTTELGESDHRYTYPIGSAYPYFSGAGDAKRVARLNGETWRYWTRSPDSYGGGSVRCFSEDGGFFYGSGAYNDGVAVRPALNLKANILVSEIKH